MNNKIENMFLRIIKKKAYQISSDVADSKCIFYAYQKEPPKLVKDLKKKRQDR